MHFKDELRLRIQQKIRDRFPLEEQKKLAKNYYSLFRDELVNMAIEAFVEHSNGKELAINTETNTRGPKPIYNDKNFLAELKDLLERGDTIEQMKKILGVSQFTISRAKNYLKERDSKEG